MVRSSKRRRQTSRNNRTGADRKDTQMTAQTATRSSFTATLVRAAALAGVIIVATTSSLLTTGATSHVAAAGSSTATSNATSTAVPTDFREFVLWAADDVSTYWENVYGEGGSFVRPEIVFFTDPVMSPCDTKPTTPAEGPFYCDNVVYVPDAWFAADELRLNDFAVAYVIAHEIGHDVQDTQGIIASLTAGDISSVQLELQADCLAGVWANSADRRGMLEDGDFAEATALAYTIGDDYLGFAPSQYTHGSSADRIDWLTYGFQVGDGAQCLTY
jgi:predicted metalloprotease